MTSARLLLPVLACWLMAAEPAVLAAESPPPAAPCATAKECLARLRKLKDEAHVPWHTTGLTPDGPARGLASRTIFLGGKGFFAPLAKLLSAKNDSVARAVAAVLGAAGPDAVAVFPALARELNVKRATARGTDFNYEIPSALASIDFPRALPLLKTACRKGNIFAARILLERKPESFREILASASAAKAVEMIADYSTLAFLDPFLDADKRVPYLEVASKNPKLPAALKKSVAEILAERAKPSWEKDPASALDEADRLLAEGKLSSYDPFYVDNYSDAFRVVARAGKAATPFIPRLCALQKGQAVVAARATWTLGEIPDPAARAAVQAALASNDWRAVLVAANALGRQGKDAKGATNTLAKLGKSHWHPAVRAMAQAAALAVSGKGPAPAPVEDLDGPAVRGPTHSWGQVNEELGTGFRCKPLPAWGKPAPEALCPLPGELTKKTSCNLVQRLDGGSLRVEPYGKYALIGPEAPPKLKLEFVPHRAESRQAIGKLVQGYIMGVTGKGARAVAVESEFVEAVTTQQGIGPGRTWLDIFDKRGEAWTPLPAVELPPGLGSVERLPDGGLELGFPNSQLVLRITPDGQVVAGDCHPDPLAKPYSVLPLVQAVLDEPGFGQRLAAGGAVPPLHLSFEFAPPAGAEKLRFAGQPVVVESDARTIAAGRTLDVRGVGRESAENERRWISASTDVLDLWVTYAAMQIEEEFRLAQDRGIWKVLPPEVKTKEPAPGSAEAAPPPPDVEAPPRDALTTESGLAFKIIAAPGDDLYDGQMPEPGAIVTVDVTAWTSDGKPYFPLHGKAPARVQVPLSLAIGGLAEGILMMKTSEARRFWLPARLAFAAPSPEQKDLVLDVRLVEIAREDEEDLFLATEEEIAQMKWPPRDFANPPKSAPTTPSGLVYRIIRKGEGKPAAAADTETAPITYKAWIRDGRLYDRGSLGRVSYGLTDIGTPLPLLLPGLAEGIRLMPPNSEYLLWIPAELAYGNQPRAADVPPGMIVVDVQLAAF
jgi:FKBP-type peptidyl-prolyl cis-trans isomerase